MILYFSGTGNSKFVAKKLSSLIDDEVLNLHDKIRTSDFSGIHSEKTWVLVTPTYAWQIPRIVRDFIRKTPLTGSKDIYFVLTCSDEIGNAEKYERALAKEKGLNFKGIKAVIMPENYIALFDVPGEEESKRIIDAAIPVIEGLAEKIKKGESVSERVGLIDKIKSSVINAGFYPVCVHDKKFWVRDICTGCGLCEKLCPVNNIEIKDRRPIWKGNCTHCMACICRCPSEAIEYGKKSVGQVRYRCK